MTAIAQELDRRLQTLEPKKAARFEQLVRDVIALLDSEAPAKSSVRKVRPPIDRSKLGRLKSRVKPGTPPFDLSKFRAEFGSAYGRVRR